MNVNVSAHSWTQEALAGAPFTVERIGRHLGAQIHGLDLTKPLDGATFRALEAALIENKVIFARAQHLTTAQHVSLSEMFGELEVHPFRPEGEFPTFGIPTRRFASGQPSTQSCAARSCPRPAAILCGAIWRPSTPI